MNTFTDIRPSPLAGRWYPADPKKLADSVDGYIQAAKSLPIEGEILGIISPHAGHMYSGPVAGYSFAALQGLHPDLVVILSPFHQFHPGAILSTAHQAYQTPLGLVPIDSESLDFVDLALQKAAGIQIQRIRNDGEHAVEILLPFFQRVLEGKFELLPLMIRQQDPELMKTLGMILANLMAKKNLLLTASTDLSHFYPAGQAREMDQVIINKVISLDPTGLYQAEEQGRGSACGIGAVAAVIWAVKQAGPITAHQLHYAHSGDVTGDTSSVVGYSSIIFTR